MKFTNYLERITDVSIYPVISLLMFVSFFAIVTLWVIRTDKKTIKHMENLPLENEI